MHKFLCISLVLVGVIELSIDHSNESFTTLQVESQLLLPEPIEDILRACILQLLHHIHVMNGIHDQCLVLQIGHQAFGGLRVDLHGRVFLQDLLNIVMEFVELSVFDRILTSIGKYNRLGQA